MNVFFVINNSEIVGLEDQLLGRVILTEKAELEAERTQLIMDVTANRRKMQELESNLLQKLTTIEGSLVEDVSLIQVLNVTKATATEVQGQIVIFLYLRKHHFLLLYCYFDGWC